MIQSLPKDVWRKYAPYPVSVSALQKPSHDGKTQGGERPACGPIRNLLAGTVNETARLIDDVSHLRSYIDAPYVLRIAYGSYAKVCSADTTRSTYAKMHQFGVGGYDGRQGQSMPSSILR